MLITVLSGIVCFVLGGLAMRSYIRKGRARPAVAAGDPNGADADETAGATRKLKGTIEILNVVAGPRGVETVKARIEAQDGRIHSIAFAGALGDIVIRTLIPTANHPQILANAEVEVREDGSAIGIEFSRF